MNRPERGGGLWQYFDYQKPSLRYYAGDVVHQDGAEVGKTREIVTLYHWRGLTMREIGVRYGINESRVSQIHKRALGLMAGALREQGITGLASVLPT